MTTEAPQQAAPNGEAANGGAEGAPPGSKFPDPIPEDWKQARAAATQQWFEKASKDALRAYKKAHDKVDNSLTAAKAKADNMKAQQAELHVFEAKQAAHGREISSSIAARLERVAQAHAARQIITLPHYTAVRPLSVLYWGQASFREKLYVRGLVSTLMANGTPMNGAPPPPELVWWDQLQPRLAMQDRSLCRLEAIMRSRVVLLVLSQGYVTSPEFPAERDLILNRLLDPGEVNRRVHVVVLRFSADPRVTPPTFPLPIIPAGHPLTVVTLGTTIPPTSSHGQTGNSPVYVQVEVGSGLTTKQQILQTIEFVRGVMTFGAGIEMPPEADVKVYFHPLVALAQAPASMSATMTVTASSLASLPAATPMDPGASWAAAHQLPSPLGMTKALEDWSVHDVQIWIRSHGTCFDRYCWGFEKLGVDGWLLAELTEELLQTVLGVDDAGARKVLMERLRGALRHTSCLNSTGNLLPPGEDPPELLTLSPDELQQVLEDVFMHYDRDESGDLVDVEVGKLLLASGLQLTPPQVFQVVAEYDADGDGVLSPVEAIALLKDIWRLVVASRDAVTWNVRKEPGEEGWDDDEGDGGVEGGVEEWALAQQVRRRSNGGSGSGVPTAMSGGTGRPTAPLRKSMLMEAEAAQAAETGGRPKAPLRKSLVAASVKHRMSMRATAPWAGAVSRAASMAGSKGAAPWAGATGSPTGSSFNDEPTAGASRKAVSAPQTAVNAPQSAAARAKAAAAAAGSPQPLPRRRESNPDSETPKRTGGGKGIRFDEDQLTEAGASAQPAARSAGGGAAGQHGARANAGQQQQQQQHQQHQSSGSGPLKAGQLQQATQQRERESVRVAGSTAASSADNNAWRRPSTHVSFAAGMAASFKSKAAAAVVGTGERRRDLSGSGAPPQPSGIATGGIGGMSVNQGARSVVGTAAAVAELDVFFEAEEGALALRGTADQGDLSTTLRDALTAVDLRHSGRVDGQALRAAVGRGLPAGTLSPYELWLLCSKAPMPIPGTGLLGAAAAEVSIEDFTNDAVDAIANCQQRLMEMVYSPQGTQQTLWKLYMQLRPLPPGCVATDRGTIVQQDRNPGTPRTPDSGATGEGLHITPLTGDDARHLLDIVVDKVLKVPHEQRLPLLVQEGILQEARAEVEACLGSGHEVNTWSSITAHMLHVYMSLP